MGLPSYMRSVVDRNVVMRRIPLLGKENLFHCPFFYSKSNMGWPGFDLLASAETGRRLTARLRARSQECFWRVLPCEWITGKVVCWNRQIFYFELLTDILVVFTILRTHFTTVLTVLQWRLSTDSHDCLFIILTTVSTNKQFLPAPSSRLLNTSCWCAYSRPAAKYLVLISC